ncbi:MAG: YhcH/YjgK/YiaL family protein [Bacteroidales bacterium]|nr:YhcH/YjgK/YiaL family protein [Bacteroidales bacterium]
MDIRVNPYYLKAQEFIAGNDLKAMPKGTHVIEEGLLWVNIVEGIKHPLAEAKMEAHDAYYDIHIPLTAEETYGTKPRVECTEPEGEFNTKDDFILFGDAPAVVTTAQPGEQTIFGPETAHAPLIGEGPLKKAIFKIKVL